MIGGVKKANLERPPASLLRTLRYAYFVTRSEGGYEAPHPCLTKTLDFLGIGILINGDWRYDGTK